MSLIHDDRAGGDTGERPASTVRASDVEAVSTLDAGGSAESDDESTVGTGSAIALGCIGATLLLIVLGLILLAVFALVR